MVARMKRYKRCIACGKQIKYHKYSSKCFDCDKGYYAQQIV
jgi:hypothetical protein